MDAGTKEIFKTQRSSVDRSGYKSELKYPLYRTLLVTAIISIVVFSSLISQHSDFSDLKNGMISVLFGACMVAAINLASLAIAVFWKHVLGTQFVEGFHRTLLAIYFLPLCFAVIFIAVIFVSLVVDVTS